MRWMQLLFECQFFISSSWKSAHCYLCVLFFIFHHLRASNQHFDKENLPSCKHICWNQISAYKLDSLCKNPFVILISWKQTNKNEELKKKKETLVMADRILALVWVDVSLQSKETSEFGILCQDDPLCVWCVVTVLWLWDVAAQTDSEGTMQSQKWKYCILHLVYGLAIYSDNDNAKRARQAGIWNTHTHTQSYNLTENILLSDSCGNVIVFSCASWLEHVAWPSILSAVVWNPMWLCFWLDFVEQDQNSIRFQPMVAKVDAKGSVAGPTSASRWCIVITPQSCSLLSKWDFF